MGYVVKISGGGSGCVESGRKSVQYYVSFVLIRDAFVGVANVFIIF